MSQAALEHYLAEYERVQTDSPAWLDAQRQSAIESLRDSGFPTLKHEHWKYTDVRPLTKQEFITTEPSFNGVSKEQIEDIRFQGLDCHDLVFVNGCFSAELSQLENLPEGIRLESLASAMQHEDKYLNSYLTYIANSSKNAFAALNTAFMSDGAYIVIEDNVVIEKPINLLFLSNKQEQSLAMHPRNLIVMGKHTQATVVESYIGLDDAEYFTNTVTEVVTNDGAQLDHYKVQQESLKGFHIGYLSAQQHQDSRIDSHSISLGGGLVRNDIDVDLTASGAHIALNGLYMASGTQHVDNHTLVNHAKAHTSSEENYRGVLNDKARGVFNGKVVVHEQAQKTDAQQSNANLLLSDDAEIDTKPELEIYADDVKCSHGATIGQLDENMLFYLRSRAIDENTARSLLTFAFADEVIKKIKFAPIRERLEHIVVGKLPDATLIKEFVQ